MNHCWRADPLFRSRGFYFMKGITQTLWAKWKYTAWDKLPRQNDWLQIRACALLKGMAVTWDCYKIFLSGLRALCSSSLPLRHPVPVGSCRLWGICHPNGGDIIKRLYTSSLLSISWSGIIKGEFSSYPALWPLVARCMYSCLSDTLAGGTLIDTYQGIQERSRKITVISCGQGMSEPSSW